MRFICSLIVVQDIDISRDFYENILGQKVKYDFGENVTYEGEFAIQLKPHFANMIRINEDNIILKSNNSELYFEEEDIEAFAEKIKSIEKIQLVHDLIEHPWGQRVIRLYDPDMHIIEVGESMEVVIKRFLNQGLSVEETAKRSQHPIEFVRQCL